MTSIIEMWIITSNVGQKIVDFMLFWWNYDADLNEIFRCGFEKWYFVTKIFLTYCEFNFLFIAGIVTYILSGSRHCHVGREKCSTDSPWNVLCIAIYWYHYTWWVWSSIMWKFIKRDNFSLISIGMKPQICK